MAGGRAKKEKAEVEVVSVELPAPEGWIKKFTPKQGGTPRRHEVVFISPTGEEIRYRSQLDQYLRSHPGGPPSSSFDWGTGDTPRRSSRISEKVKTSPEAEKPRQAVKSGEKLKPSEEKPKRAGRSGEKAKTSPEIEKTAAGSSGSQKGTKRKKSIEDNGDEAEEEAYVTEEDAPKAGETEVSKGSKKGKKRKKNTKDDGHKTEGEAHSADVVMEETEGTKLTKGSVEESMEPPVESQAATEHELAEAEEKAEEKVEPTAASDSEKATSVEKNGGTKTEDMEESEGMDHSKSKGADGTEEKIEENVEQPEEIRDEIEHELAEKAKENAHIEESEGDEHSKAEGEATIEGVHGSLECKTTDSRIEENVEMVEQDLETLIEIEHELAEEAKDIDDIEEEAEGAEHKKSAKDAIGEEYCGLLEVESTNTTAIEEEITVVTHVTSVEDIETNLESQIDIGYEQADHEKINELEQLDGMSVELEPWQEVAEDHGASVGLEDAETLSQNGKNKDEVRSTQNDTFEVAKGIQENPNGTETLSFIEQQHAEVTTTKNGEASAVDIRETVMLSENGGKEEDVIGGFDDFLQDFDDDNTLLGSSPPNL